MPAPLAVCLSPIAWGGLWTSRHEICSELGARGWEVLFVDPPSNAARRVPGARSAAACAGGRNRPGIRAVVPPPYLPFGVLGASPRLAGRVIERNARNYARFVAGSAEEAYPGRRVDLLINSFMPVLGHRTQRRLGPQVSLYHRSDELDQFPGWRPAYGVLEEQVAAAADVVACVSERVRQGISHIRPDASVIPNGVDTRRFRDGVAVDQRLAGLDRPIAVMVGVFDRRVDQSLLEAAASCSTLVMVGRREGVGVPAGATWLGHVDHSEIPGLLAACDVGVVCYKPGWAGDVLKIYEYLAAGLPVITSHAPARPDVRGAVAVAQDGDRFAELIRSEAATRSPDGDACRRSVAEGNSWSRRVDDLLGLAGLSVERVVR